MALFVGAIAMSFVQNRQVQEQVKEITNVDEPKSAAAFEVAINATRSGTAILNYLETSDPESRLQLREAEAEFVRLEEQYRRSAHTHAEFHVADEVGVFYWRTRALGEILMDQVDEKDVLLDQLSADMLAVDFLIANLKLSLDDVASMDGLEKLNRLGTLGARRAEMSVVVSDYLASSSTEQRSILRTFLGAKRKAVDEAVQNFQNLVLTPVEREGIGSVASRIEARNQEVNKVLAITDDIGSNRAIFLQMRSELETTLENQVLLAQQHLTENKDAVERIQSQTNKGMLVLLIVGLVFGTTASVLVTRGVTGSIGRLVSATRRAAKGDLSARALVSGTDELGRLGEAFDEMMTERQEAERALILADTEQRRLARVNAVNASIGRIIGSSLDIEKVYEAFAEQVKAVLKFDWIGVGIVDRDSRTAKVSYVSGLDIPQREVGTVVPLVSSMSADTFNQRVCQIASVSERLETEGGGVSAALFARAGLRTVMSVPLIASGRVIGTLNFASKEEDAYSDEDMITAGTVADQIAGAMANSLVFEERTQAQEELRKALDGLEKRVFERTIELEEARDVALEATEAKSRFLANMSHELRTPLNAVIGFSELLEEQAQETGNTEFIPDLSRIRTSGKHLLRLVNDVLDLARVESGKMDLYLESFDISNVATEAIDITRNLALTNENSVAECGLADAGFMFADETKLRQILFNLLSNACKFTKRGEVSLALDRERAGDKEWVKFIITDSGVGMPDDVVNKVFQPFSQADSSTVRRFGGSGLELYLSRTYCQLMGGDITVISEPGRGSIFTVSLPAVVVDPAGYDHTLDFPELPTGSVDGAGRIFENDAEPVLDQRGL